VKRLDESSGAGAAGAQAASASLHERLSEVDTWIFDLDNTLYHPDARLFEQIEARMTEFVSRRLWVDAAEARRVSDEYWAQHGATLTGMMQHNGMPPEPFLAFTHDIDVSELKQNAELRSAIQRLPGRKVIYTNGSRRHALRVTERLGLRDLFDAFYAIEDGAFAPKPTANGFARVIRMDGMKPERAAMIEDDVRNLRIPKELGMTTVWLTHGRDVAETPAYVDAVATDLTAFLSQL
jgi:putative hydrolase of the HAD superfamily